MMAPLGSGAVISWLEVFRSASRLFSPIPTEPSSTFSSESVAGLRRAADLHRLDSADLSRGRVRGAGRSWRMMCPTRSL
jgi:hypothetical protein